MANTYTQLYVHVVFVVKGRQNIISNQWKTELFKYINGIVTNQNQKLMCINGMPDHLHLLLGLKPDIALSNLIRDIKSNSSKFINEKKFVQGKFYWQMGFAAFSVSQSQLNIVINYIKSQEVHHQKFSFKNEYLYLLEKYKVDYNPEYLFDEI